jgi:signal transduction histidine kinase
MAVMNNITALYNNMGLHEEAVNLYRKMLQKALLSQDSGQLSSIYTNIANAFRQLDEVDSAITYNNKGIRLDKKRNNYYGLSGGYMTKASIYKDLGILDSSLFYYSKSLKPVEDMFMRSDLSAVLGSISEVYYEKKQFEEALVLIDSCISILLADEGDYTLRKQAYEMKAMILGDMNRHQEASLAWREAYKTAGIIDKSNLDARLIGFSYDTKAGYFNQIIADKNIENSSLKAKNEQQSKFIFWSAIGAILLAGLLISLYVAWYSRARYNKILVERNEDLSTRLKDRERMLSLLAHDFRSPLQSMRSMLELFEHGNLNEQERSAFIAKAKRNIQTSLRGIDQMLFWITKDRKTIEKTRVDLHLIVKSSINFYALEIEQREAEINYSQLEGTFMNFDSQHLEIIIRNLINNSVKYGHKGVKIDINFSNTGDKEILSIHDNGPGIESSVLDLIQRKSFKDLKPKTSGIHSSTGIGLELVFELAKMNHAEIVVDSSKNSGTSVSIICTP